jgi:hypothetical protein
MYKVTIKTKREPLILDDNTGLKVKEVWTDPKKPKDFKLTLDNASFEKGMITLIEHEKTSKKPKQADNDPHKIEVTLYKSWRKKTPEQKAERLQAYVQCFRLIHNKLPSDEILALLKTNLIKFFKENPKRTYGDLIIYQKFLVDKKKHDITRAGLSMITLFARVIQSDVSNAMYVK